MVVNAPRGPVQSPQDQFEVFYIDYGNQEVVPYSNLRPVDSSVADTPALAQLCTLAFIKVPSLEEEFGQEAAEYFSEITINNSKELKAVVEERDASGGKTKGQGTGPIFSVTLSDAENEDSINAAMLKEGLARLEKRRRLDPKDRQLIFENLETCQAEAKLQRRMMWQYGDVESDDEELPTPVKKAAGRR